MVKFSESRVRDILSSIAGKRIAVVGDLMVDHYYWGTVSRISPEAPVPVVEVDSEAVRLGGAANVANNILALGGEPLLVGLIGDDHPGRLFQDIIKERNLSSDGIVVDGSRPTTIKTRVIAHGQHVVRIDNESKKDCPEHIHHRIIDAVKYNIRDIDAIILEDYNKGVLTASLVEEIIAVANKYDKIIAVDPKLHNFFNYKNVTLFKPNRREVEEAMGGRLYTVQDIESAGKKLLERLNAKYVLLTRGEDGMALFGNDGEISHIKSVADNVQDVSGAGDTVISTLTIALAGGASMFEAASLANLAASVVLRSVGIAPVLPEELVASALKFAGNSDGKS